MVGAIFHRCVTCQPFEARKASFFFCQNVSTFLQLVVAFSLENIPSLIHINRYVA